MNLKQIVFRFAVFLMECIEVSSTSEDMSVLPLREGCYHPSKSSYLKISFSESRNEYGRYPVGTEITYQCDVGYDRLFSETRRCLSNGTWTEGEAYCGTNVARDALASDFSGNSITNPMNVISEFYKQCSTVNGIYGIWEIQLKEITSVDIVKVAIQQPNESENLALHIGLSSPDAVGASKTKNLTFLPTSEQQEVVDENRYMVYTFSLASVPVKFLRVRIFRAENTTRSELTQPFSVCNIAIYSTTTLPANFCQVDEENVINYGIYNNTCYFSVRGQKTEWKFAENNCKTASSNLAFADRDELREMLKNYVNKNMKTLEDIKHIWIKHYDSSNCHVLNFPLMDPDSLWRCHYKYTSLCQKDIRQCGNPDQREKSVVESLTGTMVTYSCPEGHFLNGSSVRECIRGHWTNEAPSCHVIDCGIPNDTQHWILINGSTAYGSWTKLCLDDNWKFKQCDHSGHWIEMQCDSCVLESLGIHYDEITIEITVGIVLLVISVTWLTVIVIICRAKMKERKLLLKK